MAASPVDIYRRQTERELRAGNATEHTHRPALKTLVESLAPKVTATNEPKRVECGAPDLAVIDKRGHGPVTLALIQAKEASTTQTRIEHTVHLRRRLYFVNTMTTNY
jgi:hypothetical protein